MAWFRIAAASGFPGFGPPIPRAPVTYVLSAHAAFGDTNIPIPQNFAIQFYSVPGQELVCTRHLQTEVCRGESNPNLTLRRVGWTAEYKLYADPDPLAEFGFLSGVKDCEANTILINFTAFHRQQVRLGLNPPVFLLSLCLNMLATYHATTYPGRKAVLHFLACRSHGGEDAMINTETGLLVGSAGQAYSAEANASFRGGMRRSKKTLKQKKRKTRKHYTRKH